MDGFKLDLESPLVCEGIIGDGCGGGRIFFVEDATLKTYDPLTKESIILLKNIPNVETITKSKCIINILFKDKKIKFDLSSFK